MAQDSFTVDVFRAADFCASAGVALGDPLSFADELVMDDAYQLSDDAQLRPLDLTIDGDALHMALPPHNPVHLDCCLTIMAPDGRTYEALILVETADAHVAAIYLLPMAELRPDIPYTLVSTDRHTTTRRFAEAATGSFATGTRITMADGTQRPIEAIAIGDMVLTRDAGMRPVRWIVQNTMRAEGNFAPVVITKGALHNEHDLVLRSDHRLFVYQRVDHAGLGRAEVLIKAEKLVDDDTIIRRHGGFIDYFQLVFDGHYIIYAEGIAAESHLVDQRARIGLPDEASRTLHERSPYKAYEVTDSLLPANRVAVLLRRASMG
ncbi:Hint domain-containing protein [Yoonia sp. BS5-3]|uniref:Hint domain-containing protein n=1 Tax=Yoonia phaeophyticola TaxID=3137369 RepID=A0ABZ2V324_9RHOB